MPHDDKGRLIRVKDVPEGSPGQDVEIEMIQEGRAPAPATAPDQFAVRARKELLDLVNREDLSIPVAERDRLRTKINRLFASGALDPVATNALVRRINNILDGAIPLTQIGLVDPMEQGKPISRDRGGELGAPRESGPGMFELHPMDGQGRDQQGTRGQITFGKGGEP